MSKRAMGTMWLALGIGLAGFSPRAFGQDGPPIVKPTPEHERLAKEAGTWDATVKSYERGPDSEPVVSNGVEVIKVLPGGLWTLSEFDGKFGEMNFHGRGQSGYDPKKKKYIGTWVDSMSPEVMILEGEYDPKSEVLTMHSKGNDPTGKPYEAKMTSKYESDDSRTFTMSMKNDETGGKFVKMMEISYKRRGSASTSK
jgi:Protein of unknown function (DUF1579)